MARSNQCTTVPRHRSIKLRVVGLTKFKFRARVGLPSQCTVKMLGQAACPGALRKAVNVQPLMGDHVPYLGAYHSPQPNKTGIVGYTTFYYSRATQPHTNSRPSRTFRRGGGAECHFRTVSYLGDYKFRHISTCTPLLLKLLPHFTASLPCHGRLKVQCVGGRQRMRTTSLHN